MSGSYTLAYSPQAAEDLQEIYSYLAFTLLVPNTAVKQVNSIRKVIHSLAYMPLRNPAVDWEPWKSMGMRKVPVDNFVVFYLVNDNTLTVTIIRIVYGGRDIASLTPSGTV